MKHIAFRIAALFSLVLFSFAIPAQAQTGVRWHVDSNRVQGGDGLGWLNAISSLDVALSEALPGDEVWVARGVYRPSVLQDPQDSRSAAFTVPLGVVLRGGFEGRETALGQRGENFSPTTLSGNLGDLRDSSDNAYHVVLSTGDTDVTYLASGLDGFSIRDGNADRGGYARGAGLRVSGGFLRIQNCTFEDNFSLLGGATYVTGANVRIKSTAWINNVTAGRGGGLSIQAARCQVVNAHFAGNTADRGGAIYAHSIESFVPGLEPPVSFVNVIISNNVANRGGGVFLQGSQWSGAGGASFSHCTISRNQAFEGGGGVFARTGTPIPAKCLIQNSIVWENYAPTSPDLAGRQVVAFSNISDGVWGGLGNMSTDPLFVDPGAGDFHLRNQSPCIDAGSNELVEADLADLDGDGIRFEAVPMDADGQRRLMDDRQVVDTGVGVGPIVDLGAYER